MADVYTMSIIYIFATVLPTMPNKPTQNYKNIKLYPLFRAFAVNCARASSHSSPKIERLRACKDEKMRQKLDHFWTIFGPFWICRNLKPWRAARSAARRALRAKLNSVHVNSLLLVLTLSSSVFIFRSNKTFFNITNLIKLVELFFFVLA